ncbi:unnamed protein product [Prunus armeniaca]|uniref:Uncharacterized protein n=1 Tax=Prunus armeniaca TaxID=36596 RepID=A0A6J5TSJ0_PRUAR|nr:unnamed protein product [Prunus armeniaca]
MGKNGVLTGLRKDKNKKPEPLGCSTMVEVEVEVEQLGREDVPPAAKAAAIAPVAKATAAAQAAATDQAAAVTQAATTTQAVVVAQAVAAALLVIHEGQKIKRNGRVGKMSTHPFSPKKKLKPKQIATGESKWKKES